MTLEQLERRLSALEREVAELRKDRKPVASYESMRETFGTFANDPFFDEMVRLGREYRESQRELEE